jgi:secreted trypsin-like serine protease
VSAAGRASRLHHAGLALLGGAAIGVGAGPAATPGAWASQGDRSTWAHATTRAHASIVGGERVSIASFPFQAALYDPAAGGPAAGFFCGGVIVDATHVVTAAHCLAGVGSQHEGVGGEVAVLAGSASLTALAPGSVRDPAVAVSIDPRYDRASDAYDVGVVTLARALWSGATPQADGSTQIAPLGLEPAAAAEAERAGIASVSGWGDTGAAPASSPSYPSELHAVSVPLVSAEVCAQEYAAIELQITPAMICAGSSKPQADSCFGDSGGPLVVDRDTPARAPEGYVLVGLVDFGAGCAQPGFAGVYTRIADPAVLTYLASGVGAGALPGVRPADRKRKRVHRRPPAHRHGRHRRRGHIVHR